MNPLRSWRAGCTQITVHFFKSRKKLLQPVKRFLPFLKFANAIFMHKRQGAESRIKILELVFIPDFNFYCSQEVTPQIYNQKWFKQIMLSFFYSSL